jgi:DNA-binding NarL/FixJ family response regulator
MLEAQLDCQVIGDAANGREAVQKISQSCPDIAILDITMPELNGIEVARQISDTCPETKVIILSIHDTKEYIFHALQAGVQGYLLKESASNELIEAIHTIQQGHYYLSPSISDKVIADYKELTQIEGKEVSPLLGLSSREIEILQLTAEGKSNSQIGDILCLSPKSVHTYRKRLMQKLDIHDLPTLVKFAIRHGLTSLE